MSFRLVAGLGNPGPRYESTRHNAGFWFVDAVARVHRARFSAEAKAHGELAELMLPGARLRLLKPSTFMNHSGRSVAAVARYFDYTLEEILIVHDEIDLPPGTVRLKRGGGHGGHNGLRDVIPQLGGADFCRLRIGVGHPGRAEDVVDYVLSRPGAAERKRIDESIERALELFPRIAGGDLHRVMTELNRKPAAPDPDGAA